MNWLLFHLVGLGLLCATCLLHAEVSVDIERNSNDDSGRRFAFKKLPPPSRDDAGNIARFSLAYGASDGNSAELSVLQDGRGPSEEDQPQANFFFEDGSSGGG